MTDKCWHRTGPGPVVHGSLRLDVTRNRKKDGRQVSRSTHETGTRLPVMEKRGYRTPVRFRGPFHAHQRHPGATLAIPLSAPLVTCYRVQS